MREPTLQTTDLLRRTKERMSCWKNARLSEWRMPCQGRMLSSIKRPRDREGRAGHCEQDRPVVDGLWEDRPGHGQRDHPAVEGLRCRQPFSPSGGFASPCRSHAVQKRVQCRNVRGRPRAPRAYTRRAHRERCQMPQNPPVIRGQPSDRVQRHVSRHEEYCHLLPE